MQRFKIHIILFIFSIFGINKNAFPQISELDTAWLSSFVEQVRIDWNVPGVGISIVKGKDVIYTRGFGYKDLTDSTPVDENTVFAIGSATKAFTAAAILKLQDDSLLSLDDPVKKYLQDFKMQDKYLTENTTIRDLLTHRTGLPRHDLVWYGSDLTRKQLYKKIRYLQPSKGFRETFQYQNLMYMTAGLVVEKITGKKWESYVKENLLTPLDMKRTSVRISDLMKNKNHAKPYILWNDNIIQVEYRSTNSIGPAGSINSTPTDLAKWVTLLLNDGSFQNNSIISSKSLYQMMSPQVVVPSGMSKDVFFQSYGLGWFITSYKGHLRVEHGGNIDGYTSNICLYPMDSIGIVILTNMNGSSLPAVIRNTVFDKLIADETDWNGMLLERYKKAIEMDKEMQIEMSASNNTRQGKFPLNSYTGVYSNPGYGEMFVSLSGDSLKINYHTLAYSLKFQNDTTFLGKNEIFGSEKFYFKQSSGKITGIEVKLEPELSPIKFERNLSRQEEDELSRYTGAYIFEDKKYRITSKGRDLFLKGPEINIKLKKLTDRLFTTEENKSFYFELNKDKNAVSLSFIINEEEIYALREK